MSTDAREQRTWQNYLQSHHQHVGLASQHPLRAIEFEANFGPHLPAPPARVLEIGFGRGETLRELAARGYEDLHGWDISRPCVEEAQATGVPGTLRHVDAIEAMLDGGEPGFDAILAKDVLEHLPPERVLDFTRGLRQALRPGGVFLARVPNMANPFSVFLRYDDFTHTVGFTENAARQVFCLGGFERADVDVVSDVLPAGPLVQARLWGTLWREKVVAPAVRALFRATLHSQRKGPPKVSTLRLVIVARAPSEP